MSKNNTTHPTYKKPWEDCNGRPLSNERLRAESLFWSKETWKEYLKTPEHPQTEILVSDFDRILNEYSAKRGPENSCDEKPEDELDLTELTDRQKQALETAIKELSITQQAVIRLLFWDGLSMEKAAKTLGVTKSTIQVYKKRATILLKQKLAGMMG